MLRQEAQKIKALAEEADTVSAEQLRKIIQSTVFAEFEKSELNESSINHTLRDVGSIVRDVTGHEYFRELEKTANNEIAKENQNFEKNKIILNEVKQKLATLDAGRLREPMGIHRIFPEVIRLETVFLFPEFVLHQVSPSSGSIGSTSEIRCVCSKSIRRLQVDREIWLLRMPSISGIRSRKAHRPDDPLKACIYDCLVSSEGANSNSKKLCQFLDSRHNPPAKIEV